MSHWGITGMRIAGNMPGHFRILSQEKRIIIPYCTRDQKISRD